MIIKICNTHKKFKTGIKSWIPIEKKCTDLLKSIKKLD